MLMFKSQKGVCKIKLEALKNKGKIEDSYSVELESKRCVPKLDVSVTLRQPVADKEFTTTSKTVLTITKTFPPFKGDATDVPVDNTPVTKPDITQKTKETVNKPKPQAETKPQAQAHSKPNAPPVDASEFTKEELADPDIPDNFNSMKVLEFKLARIQKEIDGIEGRAPAKLREKLVKTKVRKNVLESQLGDALSVDSYILIMKKQLDKDRKLLTYFEQNKMPEQAKKVSERIPLIVAEMEEAITFAKQQKK